MKKYTKLAAFFLSLALLVQASVPVLATADTDPAAAGGYTYKIRIYAGNQGVFSDGNSDVIGQEAQLNDRISGTCQVKLSDPDKYYVRGIRESGRDNDTVPAGVTATAPNEEGISEVEIGILVESDRDYVVAYGIRGNMVEYTVEYVDSAGNELIPARTYEGKLGDKQIVPYQYIEGYRPNAYSMAKTLKEDEENVFRFVYTLVTAPNGGTIGEGGERVTYVDNGMTIIRNPVRIGETTVRDGGTTVIGGEGGAGGADGQGADGADGAVLEDEQTPLGEPAQLIDLDDEEVPLAGNSLFDIVGNARLLGIPLPVIGAIVLFIAVCLWFALVYTKKRKKETES